MRTVGLVLNLVLWIALVLLFARFVLDWVQMLARNWRPRGLVAVVCEGLYSITDPPLRTVRRAVPPLRLGSVMLDLSLMILIFAVYLLQYVVRVIFL